jgi:hypothetical protein
MLEQCAFQTLMLIKNNIIKIEIHNVSLKKIKYSTKYTKDKYS